MSNTITVDRYRNTKRWLARFISVALWIASIQFSMNGFNIEAGAAKTQLGWLSIVLGVFVTVMELVWNTPNARKNLTILFGGILAYGYGIFTNVMGFYGLQGYVFDDAVKAPQTIIFAAVVGIICEIIPEALMVWSLLDEQFFSEGDFVGNIFGVHGEENKFSSSNVLSQQNNQRNQNKKDSSYVPQHRPDFSDPSRRPMPQMQGAPKNQNQVRSVMSPQQKRPVDPRQQTPQQYNRIVPDQRNYPEFDEDNFGKSN